MFSTNSNGPSRHRAQPQRSGCFFCDAARHKPPLRTLLLAVAFTAIALTALVTTAYAEPEGPNDGGVFTVNMQSDGNDPNNLGLTLREAMLLARGGTGPEGLNRLLSASEVIHVQGCSFAIDFATGDAHLDGNCGKGKPDTIRFLFWDPGNVLEIKETLPPINDTAPTVIDGEAFGSLPILDLAPHKIAQGIYVGSDGNVIKGLTIRGLRCNNGPQCPATAGVDIWGNNNHVENVTILDLQSDGIFIEGEGNLIEKVRIGVPATPGAVCPPAVPGFNTGNVGDGIYFSTGAQNNIVRNSIISCNGSGDGAGIRINGANSGTVIGPNNRIGTASAAAGAVLGNFGSGIALYEAQGVTIISNTIAYNGASGVELNGASQNTIVGNVLRANFQDGLTLFSASNTNEINQNKIYLNKRHGVHLLPYAAVPSLVPTGNRLVGNWIGTANAADLAGNDGSGVVLNGARNTEIGAPLPAAANIVGGNKQEGILLQGGATDNRIANTYIGTNGFTPLPNTGNGVVVEGGARENQIGWTSTYRNVIAQNGKDGVVLRGTGTVSNTLGSNQITENDGNGVRIIDGASGNNVGGVGFGALLANTIAHNLYRGIEISYGPQQNLVGANRIYANGNGGIVFWGAETQRNMVHSTQIYGNQGPYGDGIGQGGGAGGNSWSKISTHDNTGLGIDVNVSTTDDVVDAPHPVINQVAVAAGQVTVSGKATASSGILKQVAVEIYRVADDPSGYGEGQKFVASGPVDASGNFAVSFPGPAGCFTAFLTNSTLLASSSSEFGPNACLGTPQTITFAPIGQQFMTKTPFQVNPTASSGLPVTLSSEGQCEVNGNIVKLISEGTCILTAQQPGDALYAPAPDKVVQFAIVKQPQAIVWDAPLPDMPASSLAVILNATATSGLPVSYTADGACTVINGVLGLIGMTGSCTVTAQQLGDEVFQAAPEIAKSFEVTKVDHSIEFEMIPDKLLGVAPFAVVAEATSGAPVTVQSNTSAVCTVSDNVVTLVAPGTCTLVASQGGNELFNPAPPVTRTFTVTNGIQPAATQFVFLPAVSR